MMKLVPYLGGILGGYALLKVPTTETFLAILDPTFDHIATLAIIVFSGMLILKGVYALKDKS